MEKETKVVDTSALLDNPRFIYSFENTDLIIPFPVLKELDNLKKNQDEVGRNAREIVRILDGLEGDIQNGVNLENGTTLKIHNMQFNGCKSTDEKVIYVASEFGKTNKRSSLISQDINMRVQAKSLGLKAEALNGHGDQSNLSSEIYSGMGTIVLEDRDLTIINGSKGETIFLKKYESFGPFFPNQFLVVENDPSGNTIGMVKTDTKNGDKILIPIKNYRSWGGLECRPRNVEQNLAMNLMLSPDIHLTSLVGTAGTGKTLLALSAALSLHKNQGKTIVITKPTVPVGRDLGFLPGDIMDKMNPWLGSIFDNLSFLLPDKHYVNEMIEKEDIRIEPIQMFRGRSIPNSVIIVDELQNCSKLETKTILTRSGKDTKIFFTADLNQIDNPYVDSQTNGATYCVEKLKAYDLVGHILLKKGERSALATLAAEVL